MDSMLNGLVPRIPYNGHAVIQANPEIRIHEVLPLVAAGRSAQEIKEAIPTIGDGAITQARRIFRAKFTKLAGYKNMPVLVALFDENLSHRFTEIARGYTGISTHALAEEMLSMPDPVIYEAATDSGIDLIFTRDLRVNGREDISWHPDRAVRAAIGGFNHKAQVFPHFPLIVQIADDIKTTDDFIACLDRDIVALYCMRFGLLAPIARMHRHELRFLKAFVDYPLPETVMPKKALTPARRAKAWLRMAYRQDKLPELPPVQKRMIKDMARYLAKEPEAVWREPLTRTQRSQLALRV